MSSISKLATSVLEKLLQEVGKEDNITKIETKLVEPLIQYSFRRLYPYVIIGGIIFLLTFLLAFLTLVLLLQQRNFDLNLNKI
jgi:uncharacterized membrane protein YfhO